MLKKISFLLVPLWFVSSSVFAIGLGEITVFSKLNEPLKVQIQVVGSKSVLLDELTVKNASYNIYRKANLPNPDAFRKVRFKTKRTPKGNIIVELTTRHPFREPFITFIAELKWRKGHIVKEYTFLVDPPEFVAKHSQPPSQKKVITPKVAAPKPEQKRLKKKTLKKKTKVSSKKAKQASIAAQVTGNTYGPTKRADTLWDIAKAIRPNKKVTIHQTMQALFELNPDAFIRGNINLLKQGKTLKIPSTNEILSLSGKPTLPETETTTAPIAKKTTQAPLKKQKPIEVVEEVTPEKEPEISAPVKQEIAVDDEGEGKLKLVPTTEELLIKQVNNQQDLEMLSDAITQSKDTTQQLASENEDLAAQVQLLKEKLQQLDLHEADIDKELASIQQAVDSTSEQIAGTLSSSQITVSDEVDPSAPSTDQVVPSTDTIAQDEQTTATSGTSATSQTAQPVPQEQPVAPVKVESEVVKPKAKTRSFVRELLSNPVITFALTIFIIILLVATLFFIRKQNAQRKKKKENRYVPFPTDDTTRKTDEQAKEDSAGAADVAQETDAKKSTEKTANEKDEDDMDFFEYFEKKINLPDEEKTIKTESDSKPAETKKPSEPEKPKESETKEKTEGKSTFSLDISNEDIENYEENILKSYEQSRSAENLPEGDSSSEIDTYIAYGDFSKAEQLLKSQLIKTPDDGNLHLKLFECYTLSNNRQEFMKHIEKIVHLLNNDMSVRHRVEKLYQETWDETLHINKFT